MNVMVDGLLTQYTVTGKGRSVFMIHGWGDRAETLVRAFNLLAGQFTLIALDLPGFGATATPPSAWDSGDYANFVATFLQKIDCKPYAVIGHSHGGAVAIRGIGTKKFATDKLVLIASAGVRQPVGVGRTLLHGGVKVGKVLSRPLPKTMRRRLRSHIYRVVGSDMLVNEQLSETFKKVVRDDVQADAAAIHIPTLLIYGADDKSTPVAYGRRLNELIDGSSLDIVRGAGHFVFLDQPQAVLRDVEEFLQ